MRPLARLAAVAVIAALAASSAAAGDERRELEIGGRTRSYVLHAPPGGGAPRALVVALHGGGGNARASAAQTGIDAAADRDGFLVVHPEGTGERRPLLNALGKGFFLTWNAGSCCGYAKEHDVDDVSFVRAVVADVERRHAIDPRRVFATGISNGGMMSYRLACEASDVFAAIGVVAGALTSSPCRPEHPVSVLHVHGTADRNVPIDGGVGPKAFDRAPKPPLADAVALWVGVDRCDREPRVERGAAVERRLYEHCAGGTAVAVILVEGGGHSWPGGRRMSALLDPPSRALDATDTIAAFFAAHPRR